jgi:predicted phage tail protein
VTVSATASDSDGTISKVEFYAGATLIGTDTTAPYSVSWSNVAAGGYTLTAKATDNSGAATTSSGVNITVNAPPPAAPSGLTATAVSNSAINLTWTDQSTNETSFKIERALGAGAFSQVGTVGAGVTSYTDTGLTAGTSYSYRVRASNTGGDSAYSNTGSATTQAAATAPAAPTGLVATATAASSSAITITWVDQANNEDGFKIERKTGTGSFTQIATVGPNITTFANSGLASATNYTYRVRAYNTVGNSAYSNTASATTSGVINATMVAPNSGFAYYTAQDFGTPADASSAPTRSVLRIFENGIELGPAHSAHADIRTLGTGRFSHWDSGTGVRLWFSASDNTNPKTNGRTYTYRIGSQP